MNKLTSILETFLTVAKEESLTRAARKLGISQVAVSKQICALEAYLGFKLFESKRVPKTLTNSGIAFAKIARNYLQSIERLQENHRNFAELLQGKIKICCSSIVDKISIFKLIADFECRYPGISIEIINTRMNGIHPHISECSFMLLPKENTLRNSKTIAELHPMSLGVMIPRGIPLSGHSVIKESDLSGYRIIASSSSMQDSALSALFDTNKPHIICDDIGLTYNMVRSGGGLAIIPLYCKNIFPTDGVCIIPLFPIYNVITKLVYVGYGDMVPAEKVFARFVVENLR